MIFYTAKHSPLFYKVSNRKSFFLSFPLATPRPFGIVTGHYQVSFRAASSFPSSPSTPLGGGGSPWTPPLILLGLHVAKQAPKAMNVLLKTNGQRLVALTQKPATYQIATQLSLSALASCVTSVAFLNQRNFSYTQNLTGRSVALNNQMEDLSKYVFQLPKNIPLPQLEHIMERMEQLNLERGQINDSISIFNNPGVVESVMQKLPFVEFQRGMSNTLVSSIPDFTAGVKNYLQPLVGNVAVIPATSSRATMIVKSVDIREVVLIVSMVLLLMTKVRVAFIGAAFPFIVQSENQLKVLRQQFSVKRAFIVNQVKSISSILVAIFFTGINVFFYIAFHYVLGGLLMNFFSFALPKDVIKQCQWLFNKIVEKTILWVGTFLLYLIAPIYMVFWFIIQMFRVGVLKRDLPEIYQNPLRENPPGKNLPGEN